MGSRRRPYIWDHLESVSQRPPRSTLDACSVRLQPLPSSRYRATTMISRLSGLNGDLSQSPYQMVSVKPAHKSRAASSPRSANRSVSALTTDSSLLKLKCVSYVTVWPETDRTSWWTQILPPSASGKHRFVFAGVQFSHGRRDGFRVSKASRPSGARWRRSVVNAERASSSSKKTWNACPVIIIKSNHVSTDRSDALVSIHVTASASGRRRAMSSTAVAGSAPVTVCPSAARRHASQPVPQPMSSIDLCASASCM